MAPAHLLPRDVGRTREEVEELSFLLLVEVEVVAWASLSSFVGLPCVLRLCSFFAHPRPSAHRALGTDCFLQRALGTVRRQTTGEAVYQVLDSNTSESRRPDYQALCHLLPSLFHLCLPSGMVGRSSACELAGGVSKLWGMRLCHLMLSVA